MVTGEKCEETKGMGPRDIDLDERVEGSDLV